MKDACGVVQVCKDGEVIDILIPAKCLECQAMGVGGVLKSVYRYAQYKRDREDNYAPDAMIPLMATLLEYHESRSTMDGDQKKAEVAELLRHIQWLNKLLVSAELVSETVLHLHVQRSGSGSPIYS